MKITWNQLPRFLILAIYVGLLLININQFRLVIGDESYYYDAVVNLSSNILPIFDSHPLLAKTWWYLWTYLLHRRTGIDLPVFWRIGTIVTSIATLLVFYFICQFFFTPKVAKFAVIILAIDPIYFVLSRVLFLDIPHLFFYLLAIYYQFKFITYRQIKYIYISSCLAGLNFATKFSPTAFIILFISYSLFIFLDFTRLPGLKTVIKLALINFSLFAAAFLIGNIIFFFKSDYKNFSQYIFNMFYMQNILRDEPGYLSSPIWSWFTIPQMVTLLRLNSDSLVQTIAFFQNPVFFLLNIPALIWVFLKTIKLTRFPHRLYLIVLFLYLGLHAIFLAVTFHPTYYHHLITLLPLLVIIDIYFVINVLYQPKLLIPILGISILVFAVYFPLFVGNQISHTRESALFQYSRYIFPEKNVLYCQLCSPRL